MQEHAFIEKWKNEKLIILPVVNGEDLILKEYNDSSELRTGAYGIQEPSGELFSDYNKIDLAIIPGVSFDKVGNRLGRGKGYYDRLLPKIKAFKIGTWIYDKKVVSIDEMTNLSLKQREKLNEEYEIGASSPIEAMRSVDGTIKYLFRTPDNNFIESVYIPDDDRATLCVSSQVGCKMNCKFCMTGKQGFTANLNANQIINQIYSIPEREKLTNIVLMGMGEPLDNLDEVLKALEVLTSDYGYKWSSKRITVSTVGLQKGLRHFLEKSNCHLAISIHSPLPAQRSELMPAEKAFSITEIVDLLRNYDFSKQRRLSFEYIVFKGVNDSLIYAKELVKLLRGLDCRINLIRFHDH